MHFFRFISAVCLFCMLAACGSSIKDEAVSLPKGEAALTPVAINGASAPGNANSQRGGTEGEVDKTLPVPPGAHAVTPREQIQTETVEPPFPGAANLKPSLDAMRAYCSRPGSLSFMLRDGCLAAFRQLVSEMQPALYFSSIEDCQFFLQQLQTDRSEALRAHNAWCERNFENIHDRKGCISAAPVFYDSFSEEGFCRKPLAPSAPRATAGKLPRYAETPFLDDYKEPGQKFDSPKRGAEPKSTKAVTPTSKNKDTSPVAGSSSASKTTPSSNSSAIKADAVPAKGEPAPDAAKPVGGATANVAGADAQNNAPKVENEGVVPSLGGPLNSKAEELSISKNSAEPPAFVPPAGSAPIAVPLPNKSSDKMPSANAATGTTPSVEPASPAPRPAAPAISLPATEPGAPASVSSPPPQMQPPANTEALPPMPSIGRITQPIMPGVPPPPEVAASMLPATDPPPASPDFKIEGPAAESFNTIIPNYTPPSADPPIMPGSGETGLPPMAVPAGQAGL